MILSSSIHISTNDPILFLHLCWGGGFWDVGMESSVCVCVCVRERERESWGCGVKSRKRGEGTEEAGGREEK